MAIELINTAVGFDIVDDMCGGEDVIKITQIRLTRCIK